MVIPNNLTTEYFIIFKKTSLIMFANILKHQRKMDMLKVFFSFQRNPVPTFLLMLYM